MNLSRLSKKWHKWLSLVVGLQLIIWLGTGLYFNLMDSTKASGNEHRQQVQQGFSIKEQKLFPISKLKIKDAETIKLIGILQQPYYLIVHHSQPHAYQKQRLSLLNAKTGKPYTLSEAKVRVIALKSYQGQVAIQHSELLKPPISELPKQQNSVWQVQLNDPNSTNVYVNSVTGQVIAHVNDDRRLRDLMFKLHFMDYANSGGFNHWLIILFGLTVLLFSFTGAIWLSDIVRKRKFL
ncbi:PepSY domain-containing protein [Parashewanella tropica]|uniref:PepSY domain-containing protein n=1 Tax=Parashewanella tropica TaxID=2547970 RepID=UPI001059F323|nr:PepSY domain-containing protein [Parashewanella tropica]